MEPGRKYLKWVREQDCAFCMKPGPVDAHHIKGIGYLSGISKKAPDIATMPLCRSCHGMMHNDPGKWVDQWEFIARTVIKAWKEGIICEASNDSAGK